MRQLKNEQLSLAVPKPSKEERRNHSPICDLERNGSYIPLSGGERRAKIAKKIATRGLIGVALGTEILGGTLLADGYTQIYELSQTQPSITEVAKNTNPADADTAFVVAIGFGGLNSEREAEEYAPYLRHLGRVWALNYDDDGIDYRQLTKVVAKKADTEGVTEIDFIGDSIGNAHELAIAPELLEGDYGITDIPAFIINSGPSGVDALHNKYIQEGKEQATLHKLFPIASKGKLARWGVEMYIRHNQYMSGSLPVAFVKACGMTATIYNDTITSPVAASNQLLNSEFEAFASTDQEEQIKALGKFEQEHHRAKTSWYYLGAANDYIVNTNYASNEYAKYIEEAGFSPLTKEMVPGIIHGEPWDTPKIYERIFSRLLPWIKNDTRFELARVIPRNRHQIINAEADEELTASK